MTEAAPTLVLASSSPRRAAVLDMLGLDYEVDPPRVDEARRAGEAPERYVERLAREKAEAVAIRHPRRLVLAGDTVVVHRGAVVEKPSDADDARRILLAMSGGPHTVAGGLALVLPTGEVLARSDTARVVMRDFDPAVAAAYVETGEPLDKAGAYGIQGLGAALVRRIEGDYFTVMGLSIAGLVELLEEAGYPYRFGRIRAARGR